jgi:lipid II:glycine glycyltransferase (peptidoglycan interpeptide bridge formation enzyme)
LLWRALAEAKETGMRWLDLGGIDPEANPGTYHFKAGLGGRDVCYLGEFDAWNNTVCRVAVHVGEGLKAHLRQAKQMFNSLRHA